MDGLGARVGELRDLFPDRLRVGLDEERMGRPGADLEKASRRSRARDSLAGPLEGVTVLFLAQVFGVALSLGTQVVVLVLSVITAGAPPACRAARSRSSW